MTLEELRNIVEAAYANANRYGRQDASNIEVRIPVTRIGIAGAQPTVGIKTLYMGSDWDSGKLMIVPTSNLREVEVDEIKQLIDKYDELSWKHSKINQLKKESEKLTKINEKLTQELEALNDAAKGKS